MITITWPYAWSSHQGLSIYYMLICQTEFYMGRVFCLSNYINVTIGQVKKYGTFKLYSPGSSLSLTCLLCLNEAYDFNMVEINCDICQLP